jgi:hypothetical protein
MLKINVGLSRKLSQNYNSEGFSLNIEGELPSDVLHDEKVLAQSTNRLFQLANLMLDDQVEKAIQRSVTPSTTNQTPRQPTPHTNGNGRNGHASNGQRTTSRNGHSTNGQANGTATTDRLLTQAQARAIQNMARKLNVEPNQWARDEFGTNEVEQLTIKQASEAISVLKEQIEGSAKGGRR